MSENSTISNSRINLEKKIFSSVREVQDFPKLGILFKDINPLLRDTLLCKEIINHLAAYYHNDKPDAIFAIESRGFYFGFPLALKLGIPFVPIRKKGKLPGIIHQQEYALEYGSSIMEVQKNVIKKGSRILIHDDVLATGGTASAAAELVKKCDAQVHSFNFIIELEFLNGREKLEKLNPKIYNLASS